MRNALVTIAVLLALPLLVWGYAPINAGNWKLALVGSVVVFLVLAVSWIASRQRVQQSDSRIAEWLQRLTSDDEA
jgi:membrane protein implicated in regulation of membrane protease activity